MLILMKSRHAGKTLLQTLFFFLLVTQICFAQWVQTNGPYGGFVSSFAISGNNIFAGTYYDGIFLSTDNGSSWNGVNNGLTNLAVTSLAISGNNIFAGTGSRWGGGIFLSTDNGSSWNAVNNGLTDLYVLSLAISGNNIFAGTSSSGVWRRPLSEMTAVESNKDNLATEFALEQNYPNPFNPSTKIKYSIPQSSNVVIKVFDILGNEIETLVNEEKPAGTYEITWNATNLPSGVYFYQLKAGDFVQTNKMILLK
jgi:hypothetical protein